MRSTSFSEIAFPAIVDLGSPTENIEKRRKLADWRIANYSECWVSTRGYERMPQAMGSTQQLRNEVYYSGHVQGVGFRYTTRQVAQGFAVTGFVQNLSDGRVLLVAEATAGELKRFLEEVQQQLCGNIREVKIARIAASGEFSDFSIRH